MSFRRTSKTLRTRRYWDLREKHLTPVESREFSKLTRKYPALQRLIASRSALWANFVQEARRKEWDTPTRRQKEWSAKIASFYERQRVKYSKDRKTGEVKQIVRDWVVVYDIHGKELKRPRISPWEWYDWTFQRLPDELKHDTPRSHRVRQPDVVIPKVEKQRQNQQWIADLRRTIEREPHRRQGLEQQIRRLGGRP